MYKKLFKVRIDATISKLVERALMVIVGQSPLTHFWVPGTLYEYMIILFVFIVMEFVNGQKLLSFKWNPIYLLKF